MSEIKSPEEVIKLRGNKLYETIDKMSEEDAKNFLAFAIGIIHSRLI